MFSKKDLRTGDFVELNNKLVFVVIRDFNSLVGRTGYLSLSSYDDFLNYIGFGGDEWRINRVLRPNSQSTCQFSIVNHVYDGWGTVLYDYYSGHRIMTIEEVEKEFNVKVKRD